jgi:hypothetical protein
MYGRAKVEVTTADPPPSLTLVRPADASLISPRRQVLAAVGDYRDLVQFIDARRKALGLSQSQLDDIAGLASGYVGKVFGGSQTRRLGWLSTFLLLPELGVRMEMVEDADLMARRRRPERPARFEQARPGNFCRGSPNGRLIARVLKHLAKPGSSRDRAQHRRVLAIVSARLMAGSGENGRSKRSGRS